VLKYVVPCQNSHTGSKLVFCARQAALRYSLIKPSATCLRLIRAVTSIASPGSYSGGLCSRDW
jgi:hypothetical protein